jgi:hypothetical protein
VLDEISDRAENGKTGIHGRKLLIAVCGPQPPLAIFQIQDKRHNWAKYYARSIENEAHCSGFEMK